MYFTYTLNCLSIYIYIYIALKYIAIAALVVLICCCLALIIFVRRQVRKTEQGTEIQQYIRKKKESADISRDQAPSHILAASSSRHKLSYEQSNTQSMHYSQTQQLNDRIKLKKDSLGVAPSNNNNNNSHYTGISRSDGSGHQGYNGHNGHDGINNNNITGHNPNGLSAVSMESTPGGALGTISDDENEVEKEIYLVKIAQQNEMKQKFQHMDKQSMYEEQADDDDYFGKNLNDAMQFQQNQQDKIFNDMASEQYKNQIQINHHNHNNNKKIMGKQYR